MPNNTPQLALIDTLHRIIDYAYSQYKSKKSFSDVNFDKITM